MSADRFEITDTNGLRIDGIPWRERGLLVQYAAIRQQARDIAALKDALADEVTANEAFRKAGGARDDEDMPTFCARLVAERDEAVAHWNMSAKCVSNAIDEMSAACVERDQLRTDLAAAVAERDKLRAIDCGWIAGQPPRYIGEEWFIAKTIHSERVVLRALGDGHSYDYTTADGTYMRAKNIVKWMQFPDSQYKSAAIAEITVRAEQAEARLAAIEAAPALSRALVQSKAYNGLVDPVPLIEAWAALSADGNGESGDAAK